MYCLDTNSNPRIAELVETLREMSRISEPEELLGPLSRSLHRWLRADALIAVSRRHLAPRQYKITRRVRYTDEGPVASTTNPWAEWHRLPTHQGGFVADVLDANVPEVIHDLDLREDPVLGEEYAACKSCVAIPVYDNGESPNWTFNFKHDPRGFTVDDLEIIMLLSNLVGRATKNLIAVREVHQLHDQVREELERVASIQRSLLPSEIPDIPGLSISTYYRPCELAGGDYYDFTPLDGLTRGEPDPNGRWGFIIADVSGHGASAAVVMAMMQAIVHAYPDFEHVRADRLLHHLNTQLVRKKLDHSFVTAFAAGYEPAERMLRYACAGHYPPRIKKPGAGSPVTPLPVRAALPLAIADAFEIESQSIRLEPGDTLVMFTDGVIESFNANREMFGMEGLDAAIHQCTGEPGCIIESVTKALAEHEGGMRAADDQTIVAIRVEE